MRFCDVTEWTATWTHSIECRHKRHNMTTYDNPFSGYKAPGCAGAPDCLESSVAWQNWLIQCLIEYHWTKSNSHVVHSCHLVSSFYLILPCFTCADSVFESKVWGNTRYTEECTREVHRAWGKPCRRPLQTLQPSSLGIFENLFSTCSHSIMKYCIDLFLHWFIPRLEFRKRPGKPRQQ